MILSRLTRSFFLLFILTVFFSLFTVQWTVFAADIEAVTDSADGSSAFSVKDSGNVEQAHIDSIGNVVAKGCVRIDSGLVECSEAEGLVVDGNVGIGTVNPLSKLQVSGGLARIGLGGTLNNVSGSGDLYVQTNLEVDGTIYGDGSGLTALPSTLPAGGWVDGGTNIFQVTTTDNVGIGTTSPSTTFEIVKSANRSPLMISSVPGAAGDLVLVASSGNVGIGTVTPVGGLTVMKGNVGIGTWSPIGALEVKGTTATRIWTGAGTDTNANAAGELYVEGDLEVDGTIYGDGSGITALATTLPAAGWTDAGTNIYTTTTSDNVGIGVTTPTATLAVENTGTGDSLRVNDTALDATPFIIGPSGNVGVGTTVAGSLLSVAGGASIGSGPPYSATAAPVNGLMVEGNVGIGTATPSGALAVIGGNVGIGTWNPVGILDVKGTTGTRIWTGAGTDTNATSGGELYVEGDLEVDGTIYGDGSGITALPSALPAGGWVDGGTNVYQTSTTDNVGIGTTTPNAATLEIVKNAAQSPLKISSTSSGSGDFLKVDSAGNIGIGTTNTTLAGVAIMNGNVGIGTVNPRGSLSVSANVPSIAGATAAYFYNSNAQTNNAVITTDTNASGSWALRVLRNGTTIGGFMTGNGLLNIVSGTNDMTFNTGFNGSTSQERLRILDSTGAVGIGTATPVGGLAVMNGNVGVGTWSPTAGLEVKSSAVKIWTGAGVNTNATAPGEEYVEGDLEVDGTIYGDGSGITALPTTLAAGGWVDGGTNVYQTSTTDNVGLGTTSPSGTLEIVKSGTTTPLMVSSTPTGDGDFLMVATSGNIGIGTTANAGGVAIMNGNVGIGTWSPNAKLQVAGTVDATAFVGNGAGIFGIISGGGWTDGGTNIYLSDTADNVGIGTTTPSASTSFEIVKRGTNAPLKISGSPTGAGDFLNISSEGRIGIGTTLNAAGSALSVMSGNVGLGTWNPSGGLIVLNGNVGIGSEGPAAKLSVFDLTSRPTAKDNNAAVFIRGAQATGQTTSIALGAAGTLPLTKITALQSPGGSRLHFLTSNNYAAGINVETMAVDYTGGVAIGGNYSSAANGIYGPANGLIVEGNTGIGTSRPVGALAVMNGNVGIGTWAPNSRFEVNGAMGTVVISKAGNYTADINDSVIVVDASAGAVTITLPAAAGVKGRIYHIKKTDASANLLTIDGNGAETIDGAATINTTTQYHAFTLVCDGTNWWII